MTLVGVPLIALAAALTVLAAVITVRGWGRRGWLRRTASVLLVEALLVVTAGLIVNRWERFYPSWDALRGDTGTIAVAEPPTPGLLDEEGRDFVWRPPGLSAWHLAEPPTIVLPDDYHDRPDVTFPVVVDFNEPPKATPDAVIVALKPTARTTAEALRTLPAELRRDLRVTTTDWAVEGNGPLPRRPVDALPPALAPPLRLPS
ncbi:hypothetical protein [Actinoplanes solisilvae]|uniref:hypothetical protein n=1 Tax=Actinoplanes solisilvae TaxID=2486853 RepID=UPI000FDC646E|nr:hypothetical protein [Actinoplanes solisilvae]